MKVLHLLAKGGIGGIEVLCKDIGLSSKYTNIFCFLFDGGELCDEMLNSGLNVLKLYEITSTVKEKKKVLKAYCIENNIDIVTIHHTGFYMNCIYIYLKKQLNIKTVKVLHVVYEREHLLCGKLKFIKRRNLKELLNKSDKIVGVSNAGKLSWQNEFKIPEEKLSVIYNGISLENISNGGSNQPFYSNPLTILYIGRLKDVKGIDRLIEAIAIRNDKDCKLIIVGSGPEEESLRKLSYELGVADQVNFEGAQRDLTKYYMKAHIFVYPSLWNEVFGISIVEAMAFGLPCIVNNKGGIPEIVTDKENGYITKEDTPKGISDAIDLVLSDYNNGNILKISKNAKVTAEKFSITQTVNSFSKLYEGLLRRR